MNNLINLKTCSKCQIDQPLSNFNRDKSRYGGHSCKCKNCKKLYDQQRFQKNHAVLNQQNKAYYHAHTQQIKKQRLGYQQSPRGKYTNYKGNAKTRNILFCLTFDEFILFWQKPCTYCGIQINTIGLDRVDNDQGYTLDNCVACCFQCNEMKMARSFDSWISHIKRILKHQEVK